VLYLIYLSIAQATNASTNQLHNSTTPTQQHHNKPTTLPTTTPFFTTSPTPSASRSQNQCNAMPSSSQSLSRKRSRQEDHPPPRPAPASRSETSEPRRSLRQQSRAAPRASLNSTVGVVDQPQYSDNETPYRCPSSNTVRSEMDLLLFHELRGNLQFDCDALWNRFDSAHFDDACTSAVTQRLHDGKRWADWPSDTAERNVFSFLATTFDSLRPSIPGTARVFPFCKFGDVPLKDGNCQRKTDLVFTSTDHAEHRNLDHAEHRNLDHAEHRNSLSWAHVRIVGELKSNSAKSNCDSTIVQLANYAREVFGNQPWRRWVLCFTLCGSDFRVWQFDRGGAVASTIIDIHAQWKKFLRVFLSFATMGATEIGFDPSIRCIVDGVETTFDSTLADGSTRPFVWIPTGLPGDVSPQDAIPPSIAIWKPDCWSRLELQPRSMAPRWAIVTRAGICSRARLWGTDSDEWTYVVKDQWRAPEHQPEGAILLQCDCKAVGVPHRAWHGDILRNDGTSDDIAGLRPSIAASEAAAPVENLPDPRKVSPTSESLRRVPCALLNRVHSRLVIAPVGRSLLEFETYTELLTAIRDAIAAHRHMYTKHRILHRDVSVNNIIITTPPASSTSTIGVLIDFDLAIDTTRKNSSGATHRTGTFDFMARGVLQGDEHTPLHDLESFFYVLLWLCIYYGKGGRRRSPEPKHTVFADPRTGNKLEAANVSKGNYAWPKAFQIVLSTLAEDAQCVRFLLLKWHRLLFREEEDWDLGDDDMEESQDGEQKQKQDLEERITGKYDAILELLDMGIAKLEEQQE
jgi:hypothetical protein